MALFLVLRLHWGVAGIATATASAEWAGLPLGIGPGTRCGTASRQASTESGELRSTGGPARLFALNKRSSPRTAGTGCGLRVVHAGLERAKATPFWLRHAVLMNMNYIAAYGLDGFANATEALVDESIRGTSPQRLPRGPESFGGMGVS